ncbi:hypothetical protein BCR36DRAFT_322273, partial [Piromyces finnis]
MSNRYFNEIELKSKISQSHLNTVCLWSEKEFIKVLKYNKNNKEFQRILLSNIYLSKENYYHLLCNYNFELEKNVYKISNVYSICDIFNITINKLLPQINSNDYKYLKFLYLFNSIAIAKRAAAKLILKNFIKNNDLDYITNFLDKENIDMEIIINIVIINDERIENFQMYLNQRYIIEPWKRNESKYTNILLSLSPWLITELIKKYKTLFTLLFSNLLKELFIIFIKLTNFKEGRLRTVDLLPIHNTNIYIENLDRKNKLKLEQILCLIYQFQQIKEYQSIVDFHLKDFIDTLYQYENIPQSNQSNNSTYNLSNIPKVDIKKIQLISKLKSIFF